MRGVHRFLAGLPFLAALALPAWHQPAAAQAQPDRSFTLSSAAPVSFSLQFDSPGTLIIDRDGKFYYEDALSQYNRYSPDNYDHSWRFFTGTDIDDVSAKGMAAMDPVTVQNTTVLCENSPLSLQIPNLKKDNGDYKSGYPYNSFCILTGMWIDPDTGDWYGLIHDELFGGKPRYDGIEYARSRDQGKSWAILGPILTSPFGMKGIYNTVDPQDPGKVGTYYYGDGDPRLFIDYASGYFYVFYFSRIMNTTPGQPSGFSAHKWQHVARAPISGKMAPDSWRKYHDGKWEQPGLAGQEANLVPVEKPGDTGIGTVEYDPARTGTADQLHYDNSPLGVINITWNAYLGKYIGTPEQGTLPDYESTLGPLVFYATDDLATQKWTKIGPLPGYADSRSWYRWLVDDASRTTTRITGKTFRSYCSVQCTTYDAEYVPVTITCASGEACVAPSPVDLGRRYVIRTTGRSPERLDLGGWPGRGGAWAIEPTGDGFFRIRSASRGLVVGLTGPALSRAWGAAAGLVKSVAEATSPAGLAQQWSIEAVTRVQDGRTVGTGRYRIVNRYNGLALNLSHRQTATVPMRSWDRAQTADTLSRPGIPAWRQEDQQFVFEAARW
jgi:hypothetical protein